MREEYKTYTAEDGLLHCANCGGTLERRLPVPVLGREVFLTTCPCRQERIENERKEAEARQHQTLVDAYRGVCFHENRMREWNFDHDDGSTLAMDKAREYVANWPLMRNEGIGLLLWGGVGTGKTYMAACIANALIVQEKRVLMTDFATISNISIFDSSEYVSSLSSYDLLIIDDYGAERNSQFALQNVFEVINRRWESGKPLIVTTNLELDSIRNVESGDITRTRINDRILEMCKPIHMGGESKRTASGKQKMSKLKEVFNKGGNENE